MAKNFFYISGGLMFLSLAVFLSLVAVEVHSVGSAATDYFVVARQAQADNQERINKATSLTSDLLAYTVAIGFRENDWISPTDANTVTTEALQSITNGSDRWSLLAKAFNDAMIKELEKQAQGDVFAD